MAKDKYNSEVIENTSLFAIYVVDINNYEIEYTNQSMKNIMFEPNAKKCWKAIYGLDSLCPWCKIPALAKTTNKKITSEHFNEINKTWYQIEEELTHLGEDTIVKNTLLIDISAQKEVQKNLRELSIRDPLTNLYNRRHLNGIQNEIFLFAKRKKLPLSVLMIDIDSFKKINDTYGHLSGDKIIKSLSKVLIDNTRGSDFVYRIGGEEFVIIFPDTNINEGERLAQKIRIVIELLTVEVDELINLQFTVSIGVSEYNSKKDKSFNDVLVRADNALYVSKEEGRNRVSIL